MASTSGRRVSIPLTNRSGGAVAMGDVVVIGDGLNDNAFTTTPTANFSGRRLGIAQEDIASLATGRVLVSGYSATINSAGVSLSRDQFLYTNGTVKQATSSATRGAGAFGQVLASGINPAVVIWGMPETGAGAPSYTGSVWASGTVFPGSPSVNQRFTRTDRGIDYYWDGTRWLSVEIFTLTMVPFVLPPLSASQNAAFVPISPYGHDVFVLEATALIQVAGTNGIGVNFWSVNFLSMDTSGTVVQTLGSLSSSGNGNAYQRGLAVINKVIDSSGTAEAWILATVTKNGTPGNLTWLGCAVSYRLIG